MAKQDELAGVEGEGVSAVKIKSVDDAFDSLLGARGNRMRWGKKEKEEQNRLIALFKKHNLSTYVFDDRTYILDDIEKIKLKPKDEENGSDD